MATILIIEDNEDNMLLCCDILADTGYQILKAYTGLEGLDLAISEEPEIILLDIQLPDIDGTEVLAKLKTLDSLKGAAVVAVTSFAMAGDKESLLGKGCDGYIEKPIDPTNFVSKIEQAVAERRAR